MALQSFRHMGFDVDNIRSNLAIGRDVVGQSALRGLLMKRDGLQYWKACVVGCGRVWPVFFGRGYSVGRGTG